MGIEFIKGKVARSSEDVHQTPVVRVELMDDNSRVVEREHEWLVSRWVCCLVGILNLLLEYRQPRTDSFISPITILPPQ